MFRLYFKPAVTHILKYSDCRTSRTDDGIRQYGQLDKPCQFPFTVKGKTYYTCTWDYSFVTGYKPWCSLETDEDNKHKSGRFKDANGITKKYWGVCDDTDECNIPPRCK